MGSWGHETFENDAALDWLGDLVEGAPALFRDALSYVQRAEPDTYLDADDGCAALAAAELVAAARTGQRERLPAGAVDWLTDHGDAIRAGDAALARAAVDRVLERSELQELWDDADGRPWRASVAELLRRLA